MTPTACRSTATGTISVKKVGNQWRTFYKYDTAGRIVLTAYPSAVTGFSEGNGDLLGANPMTGNFTQLSDSNLRARAEPARSARTHRPTDLGLT